MGMLQHLLALLSLIINPQILTKATQYRCYSTGNFTSGSAYEGNRDGFLTVTLPEKARQNNGFFYTTSPTFTTAPEAVNCLGLCRLDIANSDSCSICLGDLGNTLYNNCPVQKEVIGWGDDARCIVRCAPHEFSREFEPEPEAFFCNKTNVSHKYVTQFSLVLANLTSSLAKRAADEGSLSSFPGGWPNYFATNETKLGDFERIYVLGFCLPTLSDDSCNACLEAAAKQSDHNCKGKQVATILMPSCILRYEVYPFYNNISGLVSPLPSPSHSVPSNSILFPSSSKQEGRVKRRVTTIILGLSVTTAIIGFIIYIAKRCSKKREKQCSKEAGAESLDSCLEFRLNTVQIATNNFCPSNMLGQGGFGAVYKGRLPNGRLIAVKRLASRSLRGEMEFMTEVQLVARLHHKNLVRLIGFCLAGNDRILIYELAANGSLDRFLFDPSRRQQLNWGIRYTIIQGIARGMLYLHEESQLRIIHHDLKASNILLDEYMNAKISDFGTARLFNDDQGTASKIVGTYGYMAPEYVRHGKISIKTDVFSFGVLLLEIVSGKRNTRYENQEHLLSKAWKYWRAGKQMLLMDPEFKRVDGQVYDDITQCIHIALLCVQENATQRPTMNLVILMLEGCSQSLPTPSKPAYFMDFKDDELIASTLEDHSMSKVQTNTNETTNLPSLSSSSGFGSINEISITQPYPEPR